MKTPNNRPNLYALLVGVNAYPYLCPPHNEKDLRLKACVNDVNLFKSLLDQDFTKDHLNVHPKLLTESNATKTKIVEAFNSHLGKAKPGDTVLFYFSGHGIRERTEIDFLKESEVDGRLGGIVCWNYNDPKGNTPDDSILSNKEFRYLIHQVSKKGTKKEKVHVVMVFDCCHSGSNSRTAKAETATVRSKQIKRTSIKGRDLSGFIFHDDKEVKAKIAELENKKQLNKLAEILPQGDHVMLAACREVELAWEDVSKRSVFTIALVDVLEQHKGQISYHELLTRVHNRMKFSLSLAKQDIGQTPQIYIRTENPADRYHTFLTHKPNDRPTYGAVEYSKQDKEWRIDLGALHGIPIDTKKRPTKVEVFPVGNEKKKLAATIGEVYPTHSILEFKKPITDKEIAYRGVLNGVAVSAVDIFITGEKKGKQWLEDKLKATLKNADGQLFRLVEKELDAEYVIRAKNDAFTFTKALDPDRPLVQPVPYKKGDKAGSITALNTVNRYLHQISEWTILKDLEYAPNKLPPSLRNKTTMYPVELRIFEYTGNGKEKRILPDGNKFLLQPQKDKSMYLRFELENYAPEILSCSMALMTSTFGTWVDPKIEDDYAFMNASQKALLKSDKKDETWRSRGGDPEKNGKVYIDLELSEYIKPHNWAGETHYLKLIVSNKSFEIDTFHKSNLPSPMDTVQISQKDLGDFPQAKLPKVQWEIRTFEIYATNPEYDPPKV